MPVSVVEAPIDPQGNQRWMWRATAGQGHKVGWVTGTPDEARRQGERALRHLMLVETHDPDDLAAQEAADVGDGEVMLRDGDGTIVAVDPRVVNALLQAGYTLADQDEIPQRTNEMPGPVEVGEHPKRRGRPPKEATLVPPRDEM